MRYGDVIWYLFVDARGCQHHRGQQRTTQVPLHLYDDHEHSRRAQHSSANEAGHCHDATRSWQWVRLMPLFWPMPTSVWVTSTRLSYDTLVPSGDTSWWLPQQNSRSWNYLLKIFLRMFFRHPKKVILGLKIDIRADVICRCLLMFWGCFEDL